MKKITNRIKSWIKKHKQSKQMEDISNRLSEHLKKREEKRLSTNEKIISHARKRIKIQSSSYIPQKKISRFQLQNECVHKFKNELKECNSVLTSNFRVKILKVK